MESRRVTKKICCAGPASLAFNAFLISEHVKVEIPRPKDRCGFYYFLLSTLILWEKEAGATALVHNNHSLSFSFFTDLSCTCYFYFTSIHNIPELMIAALS